ncbi:MAG TPA: biotin--[acetyl-CoA-carboxylase] ligase, partial [Acidobacteriota bacterium]|nr:biotin--[acetyl-CoA-carboxylase] ligase [Acidobacteriota bacterium]
LTGKTLRREGFLGRLIHDLDRCYGELEADGFGALAARWETHFAWRGHLVRVECLDQVVTGRAKGIDSDGALLVEDEKVGVRRIIAGDVIPLET